MCEIQGVYEVTPTLTCGDFIYFCVFYIKSNKVGCSILLIKAQKKGLIAPFLLNVSFDLLFEVIIQP